MKRTISFYESRVALTEAQVTSIRSTLKNSADAFIDKAELAAGEYQQLAKLWSGPSPAKVRKSIEELSAMCAKMVQAIDSLTDAAPGLIRQAQALDVSSARSSEMLMSMDTSLDDLPIHLRRIGSACSRAALFKMLNHGQGNRGDDARHHFIWQLGLAYMDATGKKPALRRNGQFAKVAGIVLEAVGANCSLSNDLLNALFRPSGKSLKKT